jgi:hypothetical protein
MTPPPRIRTTLRIPVDLMDKVETTHRVMRKGEGQRGMSLNDVLCMLIERGYEVMRNPPRAAPSAPYAAPKPSGLPPVPPVPGQEPFFSEGPE